MHHRFRGPIRYLGCSFTSAITNNYIFSSCDNSSHCLPPIVLITAIRLQSSRSRRRCLLHLSLELNDLHHDCQNDDRKHAYYYDNQKTNLSALLIRLVLVLLDLSLNALAIMNTSRQSQLPPNEEVGRGVTVTETYISFSINSRRPLTAIKASLFSCFSKTGPINL